MSTFIQASDNVIFCAETGVYYERGTTLIRIHSHEGRALEIVEGFEETWAKLQTLCEMSSKVLQPANVVSPNDRETMLSGSLWAMSRESK